ncbi:MAG TPA: tyrosine-protein phosphatase [Phycisphaerales bacterium]|nr:tyrosine-protein phosphatase [Phycisphaerales bacterium]HMP35906.1 tyrosine-protein phosphatase [Phycisphaerales bacterium]
MDDPTQDTRSVPSTDPARAAARRTWIVVGAIVGIVGGGIWLWEDVLEDRLIPKRWGVVDAPADAAAAATAADGPGAGAIFRSGQLHPALVERTLATHGVTVVVDLDDEETASADAQAEAMARLGIEHALFPLIGDGTGEIEQYAQAIARMVAARQAGETVLVHCSAGTYRTGGVVAMYRVLVEGASVEEARAEMIRYNWKPKNPTLPRYLNANMRTLAERLVELGVLERVPDPLPRFPE